MNQNFRLACFAFFLASMANAQAVKPPAKPATAPGPQFSEIQKLALKAVSDEFVKANQDMQVANNEVNKAKTDLQAFEADLKKDFPGYHFNEQTASMEKDAPAKEKEPEAPKQ